MNIMIRRISENKTRIRTNSDYLIELLIDSGKATFEKTTRIGTAFIINDKIENIPDRLNQIIEYLGGN